MSTTCLDTTTPDHGVRVLDPDGLWSHIDPLFRAAWALCGSAHDAEDLVQETFAKVLERPRRVRDGREIAYLHQALRHTYFNRRRQASRRPATLPLFDDDAPAPPESRATAREIIEAIASAPPDFRDAVIAVDVLGLSYGEAADSLGTREATITSRLRRGRHHAARALTV